MNVIETASDPLFHADSHTSDRLDWNARRDVGRDPAALQIEVRRRSDVYGAVKAYVQATLEQGSRPVPEDFLNEFFEADDEETREALVRRVSSIIEHMNEGNHGAYGISRKAFDRFDDIGEEKLSVAFSPAPG